MREPKFRCGTQKAIEELAMELGLPYSNEMQDWSYEVANADQVDKYFEHYQETTDENKKFVLMEILIQAINDQKDKANFYNSWKKLETFLLTDFGIHEYTIFYWAGFDNSDTIDTWPIAPLMREIWATK